MFGQFDNRFIQLTEVIALQYSFLIIVHIVVVQVETKIIGVVLLIHYIFSIFIWKQNVRELTGLFVDRKRKKRMTANVTACRTLGAATFL